MMRNVDERSFEAQEIRFNSKVRLLLPGDGPSRRSPTPRSPINPCNREMLVQPFPCMPQPAQRLIGSSDKRRRPAASREGPAHG